jgi:beta-1,2-xylosyltransferase
MPRVNRPIILFSALAVLLVLHLLFSPSSSQPSYKPSSASSRRNTSPAKNIYGSTAPKAVSSDGVEIDSRGYINYVPGKTLAHPLELLVERGKRLAAEQEAKIREVQTLEDAVDEYEREYGMKPPKGFDKWYVSPHHGTSRLSHLVMARHVMSRYAITCYEPDRPDTSRRFRFTQSSSPPTIVSPALLPYAHNPLLSFLGLPTDIVRERVDEVRQKGEIFSFTFVPEGQGDEGTACSSEEDWYPEDWHTRGKGRVRVRGPASWLWRCKWVYPSQRRCVACARTSR